MKRARMPIAVLAIVLGLIAVPVSAASITTITGSPLRINVGSDGSFQVFNDSVPGIGQIYPTSATLADMGFFARIDGRLFAPAFSTHGGTATGNLGSYTAWQEISHSTTALGSGTTSAPYTVNVTVAAPGTDVRLSINVTYVNGNNFFRLRAQYFSATNTTHTIDALLGADIYLGGSDNGIFVSVPELGAVGGRNCDTTNGDYNILLIPITPAAHFTTSGYADVWSQIAANELDDNSDPGSCIDNGAAIQWTNIWQGGTSATISAAVSFGEIPSPENFVPYYISVEPNYLEMLPGDSAKVTVRSAHNPTFDFNSPINFSVEGVPQGVNVVLDQTQAPAPGDATFQATVTLDGTVFPALYRGITIMGTSGEERRGGAFSVDVLCSPPLILGLYESQPQSQVVPRGSSATLKVTPEVNGLLEYQWYAGVAPMTGSPIEGATGATYVTPPVNEVSYYWVRVTNACGTADSLTATVVPTAPAGSVRTVDSAN
jgi:hypothetical protein